MTLKSRIIKLSDMYTEAVYGLINDYWQEAMDHNPEAATLWKEYNDLVEASDLKPPCVFQPDQDYNLRKQNWIMLQDEKAAQIVDILLKYVDSYVESIGGIFAEPKGRQKCV